MQKTIAMQDSFFIDLSRPKLIPSCPEAYDSTMVTVFEIFTPWGQSLRYPERKVNTDMQKLYIEGGESERVIFLPAPLMTNLIRYINEMLWRKDLDCLQVIHFLQKGNLNQKEYDLILEPLDASVGCQAGDALALGSVSNPEHFMMFLEEDLYLSKLGHRGPLIASRLETLIEIYGDSKLLKFSLPKLSEEKEGVELTWFQRQLKRFF